ncbi:LETM1-like protein [Corchorus olitorius]|uniref:LETM1-like protein n=1 Tax=Corchorus olitorius TaxID=93759 RepID=A0A1R3HDL9_9ROSI|nr:LETM1-like protein [Corchorus olitorius]
MAKTSSGRTGLATEKESVSFDKALESVEEALKRLENLLQELHVSSSSSGKEQLKAACSDLERIRKLKKEAEFLEASFRAKEAFLRQEDGDGSSQSSANEQPLVVNKSRGLWSFLKNPSTRKPNAESSAPEKSGNVFIEQNASSGIADSEPNEIRRFEQLRNELIELEKRVKKSADQSEYEEDIKVVDEPPSFMNNAGQAQLAEVQKKESIIEKSLDKIKETSTDVLQGTQLLAIDVAAAMELLRRALIGDELAQKEKKALRRTLTDLASVVPIGVLMLLPVTAVGHAAMLAAIQRYVPALVGTNGCSLVEHREESLAHGASRGDHLF